MIFYFSGTGNSKWTAKNLGVILNEETAFIPHLNPLETKFEGDTVGFVFPVYSWGVPPLVIDFIKRLSEEFVEKVKGEKRVVWVVMTCGDETALAPEMIKKELEKRGIEKIGIWSIIMPNDYVLLPGFDIDSKEVENEKLKRAPERLKKIAEEIREGKIGIDVTRGGMAWMKTRLVYPLFKNWGVFTSKWHSTDSCVGCGLCVRNCPNENIVLDGNRRPVWGTNCSSCVACYHVCPQHAVEYGRATRKKGQYMHPEKMKNEK